MAYIYYAGARQAGVLIRWQFHSSRRSIGHEIAVRQKILKYFFCPSVRINTSSPSPDPYSKTHRSLVSVDIMNISQLERQETKSARHYKYHENRPPRPNGNRPMGATYRHLQRNSMAMETARIHPMHKHFRQKLYFAGCDERIQPPGRRW